MFMCYLSILFPHKVLKLCLNLKSLPQPFKKLTGNHYLKNKSPILK